MGDRKRDIAPAQQDPHPEPLNHFTMRSNNKIPGASLITFRNKFPSQSQGKDIVLLKAIEILKAMVTCCFVL